MCVLYVLYSIQLLYVTVTYCVVVHSNNRRYIPRTNISVYNNYHGQWSADNRLNQSMWISWSGSLLTLGRGLVAGIDPVLFFNDTLPIDIKYIAMSMANDATTSKSTWIIPADNYLQGMHSRSLKHIG
jgi:Farnesoic acid 0-methyl transferase